MRMYYYSIFNVLFYLFKVGTTLHQTLMVKFTAHGTLGRAERWIRNWLASRQRVHINQTHSNWAPVIAVSHKVVH